MSAGDLRVYVRVLKAEVVTDRADQVLCDICGAESQPTHRVMLVAMLGAGVVSMKASRMQVFQGCAGCASVMVETVREKYPTIDVYAREAEGGQR